MSPALRLVLGHRDADTVSALAADLAAWVRSGDGMPLHQALGMRTPQRTREALRNALLCEACALVDGDCGRLAELVRAFQIRRWPRWCALDAPPPSASAIDRLFWRACRLAGELPESPRQLARITRT